MGFKDPKKAGGKRLTEEQRDRIVELRLNRHSVRDVAAEVGCSTNTVTTHWNNWLEESGRERRDELERQRTELIARLDSNAALARKGALLARTDEDLRAEGLMLAAERRALVDIARVAGYEAPRRISVEPAATMSEEEAAAVLAEWERLTAGMS